MQYTSLDLLNKAINITRRRKKIYEEIERNENSNISVKIISKVLIKEVDRNIEFYNALIKRTSLDEFENIDFIIYDKISFLIDEFNNKEYKSEIKDVRTCIIFAITLEKDIYSLIINIQGRLVQGTKDTFSQIYKNLSDVINHKVSYIAMLEKILKEN